MSQDFFSSIKLSAAIRRPWVVVACQNHLVGENHTVGSSISVGKKTFSIVEGLGSVIGLFRECEW